MKYMPNRVTQWNLTMNYKQPWYELYFDGPNSEFGSFRASPLPGLIAQNKRQVMFLLKLAYETPIRSWNDALNLVHEKHLRLTSHKITDTHDQIQHL